MGSQEAGTGGATVAEDVLDTTSAGPIAARGGALRAGAYAGSTLLGLLSAPLMIRHLGVADFGRYVTVLALVAVIAGVTEGGVAAIAMREYAARSGADRVTALRALLGIRLVLTFAGLAIGVAFAIVAGYSPVLVVGTLAAGIALLLQSLQALLSSALQSELRFGWISGLELVRQALFVAVVILLVVVGGNLELFFFAQIPAFLVVLAITAVLVRRLMPLRPSFHVRRSMSLLRDTVAYAAAVALSAMYFRIAVVALSLLASERATGYFGTALRVMEVLIGLPLLVIGAAFPILARASRDDRARLDSATGRLVEVSLVLGVWFALVVAVAAGPIITLLAGADFGPSVDLLRILAVALIASFVTVACGYALLSLRAHRAILVADGIAL
ncbi:MAG: hypothetical protein QOD69_2161, partial [Solirubrobacteraceae bacterium]|nr:hypothetical protein [Solirubrobacteraceae bacterium]